MTGDRALPLLAAEHIKQSAYRGKGATRFFAAPHAAGRAITAGFSYIQRIGKQANVDVWFPNELRQKLERIMAAGEKLEPQHFPAKWAAVRQFELLQEAGNYKIYDLDATYLTRTMLDLARNMRAGGYRVTIATIGAYRDGYEGDDLAILDVRLQDRLSKLTHMLYLEEESRRVSGEQRDRLAQGAWDYQNELPHVGVTLGSRNLFRPLKSGAVLSLAEHRHRLSEMFFEIVGALPQTHIVHDTAIGLQIPDANAENEWIYCAEAEDTLRAFNGLLSDLFRPFDGMSLCGLGGDGLGGFAAEPKATVQHMRGYGDRLSAESDGFYRTLAGLALH